MFTWSLGGLGHIPLIGSGDAGSRCCFLEALQCHGGGRGALGEGGSGLICLLIRAK